MQGSDNNVITHTERKPRGRPTTTWLKKISSDLSKTNIRLNPQNATPRQIFENLKTKTSDRNQWRKQIRVVMDDNHPNVHLGSPEYRILAVTTNY